MEETDAVDVLDALAHGRRLGLFRLLIRVGPQGLPAGEATVGDIVFQPSGSAQSQAVQEATGSKWSHVGMVIAGENGPQIIEAVQPAQIIPLKEFLAHGKSGSYEVYLQKLIRQRFPEGMPPDVAVSPQDLADSKLVE